MNISNKRTNRKWTESEKAIMTRMFQEGNTQKDIGRAINRSTSAINNALLKRRKKNDAMRLFHGKNRKI